MKELRIIASNAVIYGKLTNCLRLFAELFVILYQLMAVSYVKNADLCQIEKLRISLVSWRLV